MKVHASEIIKQLVQTLDPKPTMIRFAWLRGGQRNALKFRNRIACALGAPEAERTRRSIDDFVTNLESFRHKILTSTTEAELTFLDRFISLYRFAYGGIMDDFMRWLELSKNNDVSSIQALASSVSETLLHHGNVDFEVPFELSFDEIQNDALQQILAMYDNESSEESLGTLLVKSKYNDVSGTSWNTAMLDLRIEPSPGATKIVEGAMRALSPKSGRILISGRSYHFYSLTPLDIQQFYRFSANSLLLVPLTDSRYIGHCLLDGEFSLRISPRKVYDGPPYLVKAW